MKFTGKVMFRGWNKIAGAPLKGPAVDLSLRGHPHGRGTGAFFATMVTKSELDNLIKDLERIKEELENAHYVDD